MTRRLSFIDWTGWEQWIRVKSHDVQLSHPFHLMIIHIWWLNTPTGICFIEDFSVGIVTKMAYCLKKLHHEWFELMSSVKCLLFMVQWFMNGKMETTWVVSPAEIKNFGKQDDYFFRRIKCRCEIEVFMAINGVCWIRQELKRNNCFFWNCGDVIWGYIFNQFEKKMFLRRIIDGLMEHQFSMKSFKF